MSYSKMHTELKNQSFKKIFMEDNKKNDAKSGDVISARVIHIDRNFVIVNANLKSEGYIPIEEFLNEQGEIDTKVGEFVSVTIDSIENGFGNIILSRDRAKRLSSWMNLEQSLENGELVEGKITGKVKGGLTVIINHIKAFLPGSLVDLKPVKDISSYEGKILEFKVIKLDRKRNNVVVSRRKVLEKNMGEERVKLLETLKEGLIIKGIVKNITDYGAFIDLGGIDGLLHITDIAWRRVRHPSEILQIGQEISSKILKFDQEKSRVSLGVKQLGEDPWVGLSSKYPEKTRLFGKVTNITDYGAFVEVESGIEGLVHISEMNWTNKNVDPRKIVKLGKEVEIMILEIDENRRRISLGMKQCLLNPWENFSKKFKRGDKVQGLIKSITDFGIFIGLPGGIDGLIHLSDLSWIINGEISIRKFKKGENLEAVVLGIDIDKERISLGIKQINFDPFNNFIKINKKGSNIIGFIKSIDNNKILVNLSENVFGCLHICKINSKINKNIKLKDGKKNRFLISNIVLKEKLIYLSLSDI